MGMKVVRKLAVALVAIAVAGCCKQDAENARPLALRVGTCNVRYPNPGDDKRPGAERYPTDRYPLSATIEL